jgi:outer membrane protein
MARRGCRLLLATAVSTLAVPASADELRDALVQAYHYNPSLLAARSNQRAIDENVPIERAAGLPDVSAGGTFTEILNHEGLGLTDPDRNFRGSVDLGVPVYSGGAVKNSVKAAKIRVEAGQADLRATESAIFSQVVSAYTEVVTNEAVVGLNRKNVSVLEVNLQATSDRFEIGDLTRTDVAQSESRLAVARGDTRTAEALLVAARERYIALVGKPPVNLAAPPPLPSFPASPEEAVAVALENNPDILAARERTKAAGYDIDVAGSSRLPRVDVFTGATYNDYFNTLPDAVAGPNGQSSTGATAGVRATIPIFQGGRPAALRRQAQALASAAQETEISVERDVIAQARAAYSTWAAANEVIVSTQSAVSAAELSLEGVRAENSVGNRTILDVLNAEQELLDANVRLVNATRTAYVAGFTLLAAMGRAEAKDLNLDGGALYDPETNYKRVRGKIFDFDDDPDPTPQATRTVDTPAQGSDIPAQ